MPPKRKILVAEDDVPLRNSISTMLESSGYSVTQAGNGDIGQFMSLLSEYDLLISDIGMPEVDGIALTKFVKSRLNLPTILITGVSKGIAEGLAKDAEADHLLLKPFSGQELLEAVKRLLDAKP